MSRALRNRRRGGIIIIVAVSLTVLTGFVALAFDIGYARLMRTHLDVTLEAAAHAAVRELDFTADGVDRATEAAIALAGTAAVGGTSLELTASDVEFGVWDDGTRSFTGETDPSLVNAVRVNANITIPLLFGVVAFQDSDLGGGLALNVSQVASSGLPGGALITSCVLPLAIPDCFIDANADGSVDAGVQSRLFDAGGCATSYDASYKQAFMATLGPFSNAKAKGTILDCGYMGSASVDDVLGTDVILRVDNPNLEASSGFFETITTVLGSSTTSMGDGRWGSTPTQLGRSNISAGVYGQTIEGPVMVVDVDDDVCTTGSFEALAAAADPAGLTGTVVGFVWGAVYDIQKRCRQDSTGTQFTTCTSKITSCSTTTPTSSFSSRDRMGRLRFRVDTTEDYMYGSVSGGPDWGVLAPGGVRLIPQ